MGIFDALDAGQQAQIVQQYGSLAAARAAMEAPAPPPVGAPVAPPVAVPAPTPPTDDVNAGPVTPAEAAKYGATPKEVALSAAGPSSPNETWEQKQARIKSYGPAPDVNPNPAASAPPVFGDTASLKGRAGSSPEASPAPGINWGGAGGGGTVAAHEQKLTTQKREDELTGAIDHEADAIEGQKTAVGNSAEANAEIERQRGQGLQDIAKATEDAGVDTKLRAQAAADESKAYRKHMEAFQAQLSNDKIDPNRMWHNASTGQQITWTIAEALGAVQQAALHLPTNQVVDRIEARAVADVAAQKANHEIGRERLQDMQSMYGQALHATASQEEAERVATGYALESAKQNAQALTQAATSKAQIAKGKEIQSQLDERIALLDQKKAETGIKLNPMAQAHGGGGVDMKAVYAAARQRIAEQDKLGITVSPDEAIRWSYKLHTGNDPQPGAGAFAGGVKGAGGNMTPEQRGKIAQERQQTQTASDEFNTQMDNLQKHPVILGSGLSDAAFANLPQRVAPASNDAQQQLEAINTQMLQAVGKVAKDADGKPNKVMIEKIEKRFELHLSDTPQQKQQKIAGVRSVYNALAREQGATAPEPNKGPPPGMAP